MRLARQGLHKSSHRSVHGRWLWAIEPLLAESLPKRHDRAVNVDGTMNVLSHETFETETDPLIHSAWWFSDPSSSAYKQEVADVCEHNWDGESYDGGLANHQWNSTYYDLVDEYDLSEYNTSGVYGCVPYGPKYP